jgi:hypothetical protein
VTDVVITTSLKGSEQVVTGFKNVTSAAQVMAQKMGLTAQQQAEFVKNVSTGAAQGIGQAMMAAQNVSQNATKNMQQHAASWSRSMREVTQAIAGATAVLAIFSKGNSELREQSEALTVAMTAGVAILRAVREGIKAILLVLSPVQLAIAALAVAAYFLITNFDQVSKIAKKIWDWLGKYLIGIWDGLAEAVRGLGHIILGVLHINVSELIPSWTAVKEFFSNFIDGLSDEFQGIGKIILSALKFDKAGIQEGFDQYKKGIGELADAVKPVAAAIAKSLDNEETRKGIDMLASGVSKVGTSVKGLAIELFKAGKLGLEELRKFLHQDEIDSFLQDLHDKLKETRLQIITESEAQSVQFFSDLGKLNGEAALSVMQESIKAAQDLVKQIDIINMNALVGSIKTEEERQQLIEQANKRHEERLIHIHDDALKKKWGISKIYHQLDMDAYSDFFGRLAQMMDSHNKTAFRIGKAAAIAQAIIDTYKNAGAAFYCFASSGTPVGYALGIAAAAAAVVAGIARVKAIQATQLGGGSVSAVGGGAGIGGSAAGGATNTPATGQAVPPTTQSDNPATDSLQIIIQGNVIGNEDFVRKHLIPIIKDEINSRSVVLIGQKSRQMQDIKQNTLS